MFCLSSCTLSDEEGYLFYECSLLTIVVFGLDKGWGFISVCLLVGFEVVVGAGMVVLGCEASYCSSMKSILHCTGIIVPCCSLPN